MSTGALCSRASSSATRSRSRSLGPASSMIASVRSGNGCRVGQTKTRAVTATGHDHEGQADPAGAYIAPTDSAQNPDVHEALPRAIEHLKYYVARGTVTRATQTLCVRQGRLLHPLDPGPGATSDCRRRAPRDAKEGWMERSEIPVTPDEKISRSCPPPAHAGMRLARLREHSRTLAQAMDPPLGARVWLSPQPPPRFACLHELAAAALAFCDKPFYIYPLQGSESRGRRYARSARAEVGRGVRTADAHGVPLGRRPG